ncbi:MarR family transcriptional regulator [Haloprofundus halobius]|uniref:MarR family transcriptional regulator n=1 Tax=Haloprofundus halobius TaxID=2876194 RepID=UPI001CCEB2BF|nr:helix-turn-helix domain-containing protein [Haloprofundus halobius]
MTDALGLVDDDDLVDAGQIKRESCRIWKLETYLRFDIDRKHSLVRTIDKSENLIDVGGGAEIEAFRERQKEGWLESRLESDRWDLLGLVPAETTVEHEDGDTSRVRWQRELKVYQAQDWGEKPRDHWAHHPKVEASLGKGRNPHVDEWHEVLDRLRELVLSHCEWAGVTDDDLVADPYFKPSTRPTVEVEHPEGRREDLQHYYNRFEAVIYSECIKRQTYAAYDILSVLVERHGATYGELEAETGYSRSNLQYHIGRLVDVGLLETQGNPAVICFAAGKLLEIAAESIEDVAAYFGEETLGKRRLEREKRAEETVEKRENGEANGTHERENDPRDLGPDARGDDEDDPLPFVYLKDWSGTPQMIMDQLVDDEHPRGETDVRVRVFPDHDPDGGRR